MQTHSNAIYNNMRSSERRSIRGLSIAEASFYLAILALFAFYTHMWFT